MSLFLPPNFDRFRCLPHMNTFVQLHKDSYINLAHVIRATVSDGGASLEFGGGVTQSFDAADAKLIKAALHDLAKLKPSPLFLS